MSALTGSDVIDFVRYRQLVAEGVSHKSDVGGIVVCPNEPAAVRAAVVDVLGAARRTSPTAPIAGSAIWVTPITL